jgi:hypothetical protein
MLQRIIMGRRCGNFGQLDRFAIAAKLLTKASHVLESPCDGSLKPECKTVGLYQVAFAKTDKTTTKKKNAAAIRRSQVSQGGRPR